MVQAQSSPSVCMHPCTCVCSSFRTDLQLALGVAGRELAQEEKRLLPAAHMSMEGEGTSVTKGWKEPIDSQTDR